MSRVPNAIGRVLRFGWRLRWMWSVISLFAAAVMTRRAQARKRGEDDQ